MSSRTRDHPAASIRGQPSIQGHSSMKASMSQGDRDGVKSSKQPQLTKIEKEKAPAGNKRPTQPPSTVTGLSTRPKPTVALKSNSMSRSLVMSNSKGPKPASADLEKSIPASAADKSKSVTVAESEKSKPKVMSKSLYGSLDNGSPESRKPSASLSKDVRTSLTKNGKAVTNGASNGSTKSAPSPKSRVAKAGHCHIENERQESAEIASKKVAKPMPKARTSFAVRSGKKSDPPVANSDHDEEEEEEGEQIHLAILKQTRQSGSLNLSGRSLNVIPAKVWTLNDPDESDGKRTLSMDKVDEEKWWDRVDLTKLILASNHVSKVSPKIKKLTSLQVLDLHDNNIGCLPEEIGELVNLTKLNVSHNKLTFLPMGLFNLSNLRVLNLAHNEINEIHNDLGTLHALETIDVAHNKLIELPFGLACLSKVTNFNASHNMLESVPFEISFLRSVNCLELSHNNINEIPESIQDLHCLERLYLQHNKLKAMPCLRNCHQLKEVYLGFNAIEELTDVDLESMPNIKLLDLRDNGIPSLPDEIINLQSLERLDVSNNDLSTLPFTLGTLPHLKSLQVDGNPMKAIRRDIIARGTMGLLKYLKSRIDEEELDRLREKGQVSPVPSICGSPPIPDTFAMKSAQVMKLTGKDLTSLPKEAVDNAIEAEVTGVDLSKNQFSKFPPTLEPLMPNLFELNISSNRLEEIPSSMIGLGINLQYLNLANNKIAMLPPEIGLLVNLREICLNCNRLNDIPLCLFGCTKLETIMISDNRIEAIDVDGLKKLTKLSVLDVGNNNIGAVPPELGLLTNLRSLTLDGNAFRVPRPQVLVKGTESILAYLRDRIPRSPDTDA